jgi:hypothetical protein
MKKIIFVTFATALSGCAAMKEASKSIAVEIDWVGILEATRALF